MGASGVSELLGSGEHRKPATCRAIGRKDAAASRRGARSPTTLALFLIFKINVAYDTMTVCLSPTLNFRYHYGVSVPS